MFISLDINETIQKKLDMTNNGIFLKLNLKDYPWQCPSITFIIIDRGNHKEKELNKVYRTNRIFNKEIKMMSGVDCLHCSSYLCHGKWIPTSRIKNIIDEFKNIVDLKCRAVERVYCDKIQDQLIKTQINNNTINYLPKEDIRIANYL